MISTKISLLSLCSFLGLILLCPFCALADGSEHDSFGIAPSAGEQAGSNPGADASFDKRLPPVFPGEEVNDGQRKMKVWSSSGPVPVANAPEPWDNNGNKDQQKSQEVQSGSVGVIIDRRREERLSDEHEKRHKHGQ